MEIYKIVDGDKEFTDEFSVASWNEEDYRGRDLGNLSSWDEVTKWTGYKH